MIVLNRLTRERNVVRMAVSDIREVSENVNGTCWVKYTDAETGNSRSALVTNTFENIVNQSSSEIKFLELDAETQEDEDVHNG